MPVYGLRILIADTVVQESVVVLQPYEHTSHYSTKICFIAGWSADLENHKWKVMSI